MPLSAVSPRVFQLYSPRRPSPLGLPPLAPHSIGSQDIQPCSAYPKTPERYYHQYYNFSEPSSHGMRFPPDVHRRTSTTTQRAARASPPAPLSLDAQYHPAAMVHLPSIEETLQFRVPRAPSPTPSSTSSLSLYSTESAKKSLENGEEGDGEGKKKGGGGGGGGFCFCFSAFLLLLKLIDNLFFNFFSLIQTSQRSSVLNLNRTRSLLLKHKYKK